MPLLFARLVVAGVLGVAAAAKLADRAGVRGSMIAFGVPGAVAAPMGWCLVASEFALAAALLVSPWTGGAGFAAFALFAGFGAVIIVSVARGRAPECHCFGRLSRGRAGWPAVARNALLAAVSGYIAAGGRAPSAFAGVTATAAGVWVWLSPVSSRLRRRGAPAPAFALADETGATWTQQALLARSAPVLLIFSHPACGACRALLPDLARWQHDLADRVSIAVISGGPRSASVREAAVHGLRGVLADEHGTVARAYGVDATPSAVLLDHRGRVAATASGADEIAALAGVELTEHGEPRLGRRSLLRIAALASLPGLASACASTTSPDAPTALPKRPKAIHVDGAYVCDQRYALCTNAACVPSATNPSILICDCVVKTGYAVGFKTCTQRAPGGDTVHSNFSTQLVTSHTGVLTCPADAPWANCLDVICTIDPRDPGRARCQCLLVKNGPSVTFGGDCDTRTCSSVIWSAATSNLAGSVQLQEAMKRLGRPLTLPPPCPRR